MRLKKIMKNDLPYKVKLEIILLDFAKILCKKGLLDEDIRIKDIFDTCDELMETHGFSHFVHEFLCDDENCK